MHCLSLNSQATASSGHYLLRAEALVVTLEAKSVFILCYDVSVSAGHMYVHHVCIWCPWRPGVTDRCEPKHGFWESNLGIRAASVHKHWAIYTALGDPFLRQVPHGF